MHDQEEDQHNNAPVIIITSGNGPVHVTQGEKETGEKKLMLTSVFEWLESLFKSDK